MLWIEKEEKMLKSFLVSLFRFPLSTLTVMSNQLNTLSVDPILWFSHSLIHSLAHDINIHTHSSQSLRIVFWASSCVTDVAVSAWVAKHERKRESWECVKITPPLVIRQQQHSFRSQNRKSSFTEKNHSNHMLTRETYEQQHHCYTTTSSTILQGVWSLPLNGSIKSIKFNNSSIHNNNKFTNKKMSLLPQYLPNNRLIK